MVLLGIRAGGGHNALEILDHADNSRGSYQNFNCLLTAFLFVFLGVERGNPMSSFNRVKYKFSQSYNKLTNLTYCLGSIPSCPVEEMFLCRLLETDFLESSGNAVTENHVERVLSLRHSSTMELMKSLEDIISAERVKTESIALSLHGKLSVEG